MRRLSRPHNWLLLSLPALAALGALLLADPACTRAEPEFLQVYRLRHRWQVAFDALSAVCGAGLLTYDFSADYTARGRWTLTALGIGGALLYLAAARQTLHRLVAAGLPGAAAGPPAGLRAPPALLIAGLFLAGLLALTGLSWLGQRLATGGSDWSAAAWPTAAAFASLGWSAAPRAGAQAWPLAVVSWLGALGWAGWLAALPRLRRRYVAARTVCLAVCSHGVFLVLAALLLAALESPRGGGSGLQRTAFAWAGQARPAGSAGQPPLFAERLPQRFARSLVQVACASGAGIPTEPLSDRALSEGGKVALAGVVLAGGLPGSPGGGIKWPLLLGVLLAGAAALRQPAGAAARQRLALAGAAGLLVMLAVLVVVAFGLLLIENRVASAYQSPPTFADALLEAASAVGGANLSSGLLARLTSRSLVGGIGQRADLYQYGMCWLMLAMLVGRVLPLLLVGRLAAGLRRGVQPPRA